MGKIDLSIVIPTYNEISRGNSLSNNLNQLIEILENTKYDFEIIFVDDCSQDQTPEIVKSFAVKNGFVKSLFHDKNVGRGGSVTDGLNIAKGKIAGFIDVDFSTSPVYIPALAKKIEHGYDIATAHRIYKINYFIFLRWLTSRGYNFLVRKLLKVELKDTETGCKFFNRKKIKEVLGKVKDTGWFWDTEIMAMAYYNGLKIHEMPTLFQSFNNRKSSVRLFRDTLIYFNKLIQFKKEMKK